MSGGRAESIAPPVLYPLVGVAGGMGPLASMALPRTVYTLGNDMLDQQHAPRILLWSDPLMVEVGDPGRTADLLGVELLPRYDVAGLLAGCTKPHLVTRELAARGVTVPCVDPMLELARRIVGGVL